MKRRPGESEDLIAGKLRRLLANCPLCYCSGFSGHSYAQFASVRATREDKQQLQDFLEMVNRQEWGRLHQSQGFHVMHDAVILYAVRCSSGVAGIVVIRDPFELWEDDTLLSWKCAEGKSADSLVGLIDPADWRPLETEALARG